MAKNIEQSSNEYFYLINQLDIINNYLTGNVCDDIDCDRYMYKDCLKKHRPILEHKFSCFPMLKRDRDSLMRILSLPKYKRFRYCKCAVCGKIVDKLGKYFHIEGYTKKCEDSSCYHWDSSYMHKGCKKKFKIPKGWKKM